jgi:hypothetical protein
MKGKVNADKHEPLMPAAAAHRPRRKLSPAERQRAYRGHQKLGEAVIGVVVGPDVLEALIRADRLTEQQALERREVATACADILEQWAAHWLEDDDG